MIKKQILNNNLKLIDEIISNPNTTVKVETKCYPIKVVFKLESTSVTLDYYLDDYNLEVRFLYGYNYRLSFNILSIKFWKFRKIYKTHLKKHRLGEMKNELQKSQDSLLSYYKKQIEKMGKF